MTQTLQKKDYTNIFLKLEKSNLLYLLATIFALVNVITVFVFQNSSIRNTYFCRWLILVSTILMIVAIIIEATLFIIRYVKNKDQKIWFIIKLCLLIVSFALFLYTLIKYFLDNNIYFYHINQTNIIFSFALLCFTGFLYVKEAKKLQLQWNVILLVLTVLVAIIFMIINVRNRNIYTFNILFLLVLLTLLCLGCCNYNKIGHSIIKYIFLSLGAILLIGSYVTTCISRTVYDLLNILNFLLAFSTMLMICGLIFDLMHFDNIIQLIAKILAIILFLSSLIKLVTKDNAVLLEIDKTRLIMFAGFTVVALSQLRNFKSVLTQGYIILIAILTIVGLSVMATNFSAINPEPYYITVIVMLCLIIGLHVTYNIIFRKKQTANLNEL